MDDTFKKGDVVKYNNGKYQETFVVEKYHLYSTEYNIPSFKKKLLYKSFLALPITVKYNSSADN